MKEPEKKIEYHEDGKTIYREYYVNEKGQHHGPYKSWRENGGRLYVDCTFVNGRNHGLYRWWYYNGQIEFMVQFKKGTTHGIRIEFKY